MNPTPALQRPFTRLLTWSMVNSAVLLLMEATLFALWYRALFLIDSSWAQVLWILLAVLLGSYLMALSLGNARLKTALRSLFILLWLVLAIFASMKLLLYAHQRASPAVLLLGTVRFIVDTSAGPGPFFHMLVIGLLVWRGVGLAHSPPVVRQVLVNFQLCLMWFLIYGLAYANAYPLESFAGFYLFLFSGLVAMSMARVASLEDFSREYGARLIPRHGSGWLPITILAALVVTGLALLLGWVATWRVVEIAAQIIALIITVLATLLIVLLSPLLVLLLQYLPALFEIFKQAFQRLMGIQLPPFLAQIGSQIARLIALSVPYLMQGRKLVLAAMVVGLIAIILLNVRRWNRQMLLNQEDQLDSEQRDSLAALLNRLLGRTPWKNLRLRSPAQLLAAARIRQVYRQLMGLCRKLGHERPSAITPLEFLPELESLFPGEESGLTTITHAYIRVRYGQYPETMQEVKAVLDTWERISRKKK